jgi:hypothetical protein
MATSEVAPTALPGRSAPLVVQDGLSAYGSEVAPAALRVLRFRDSDFVLVIRDLVAALLGPHVDGPPATPESKLLDPILISVSLPLDLEPDPEHQRQPSDPVSDSLRSSSLRFGKPAWHPDQALALGQVRNGDRPLATVGRGLEVRWGFGSRMGVRNSPGANGELRTPVWAIRLPIDL